MVHKKQVVYIVNVYTYAAHSKVVAAFLDKNKATNYLKTSVMEGFIDARYLDD